MKYIKNLVLIINLNAFFIIRFFLYFYCGESPCVVGHNFWVNVIMRALLTGRHPAPHNLTL